jgi:hypothetical protein
VLTTNRVIFKKETLALIRIIHDCPWSRNRNLDFTFT